MYELRLFASLRQGREKSYNFDTDQVPNGHAVFEKLDIDPDVVAIYMINGLDAKFDDPISDGDVVSCFPAIGGG